MFEDFFKSRANLAVAAFFLFGLFILAIGAGLFFFQGKSPDDIQILSASASESPSTKIVVDVSGSVVEPGVYELPAYSRVKDAVMVAGGLTDEADSSKINMAAKVSDGQKIYIVAVGDSAGQVAGAAGGLVSINTATESELDRLPGIGPVTAAKIIASRPYSAPEDLLTKKVISSSVFEKIRDLITW